MPATPEASPIDDDPSCGVEGCCTAPKAATRRAKLTLQRPPAVPPPASKAVVPVTHAAWLAGDLGAHLERMLTTTLADLPAVRVSRLPRALLVEADMQAGALVDSCADAARKLDAAAAAAWPVLHGQMGPLWTGTVQSIFNA